MLPRINQDISGEELADVRLKFRLQYERERDDASATVLRLCDVIEAARRDKDCDRFEMRRMKKELKRLGLD